MTRANLLNNLLAGLGLCLVTAGAGCGPGKGDMSGTVTFKGKPVTSGTVDFLGSDGIHHYAAIEGDGTYSIKGVPGGAAKVGVYSPDPSDTAALSRGGSGKPSRAAQNPGSRAGWFSIPDKYGDPAASGLTFTIKRGPNTYNIDLP